MQQESDGKVIVKLQKSRDNIVCCEDLKGEFVSGIIFRKNTSHKLRALLPVPGNFFHTISRSNISYDIADDFDK